MEIGPLFIESLKTDGKIPTASFSFAMKGFSTNEASKIDIGVPLSYRVVNFTINNLTQVILGFNDDFFWSTSL